MVNLPVILRQLPEMMPHPVILVLAIGTLVPVRITIGAPAKVKTSPTTGTNLPGFNE